jgi:hypothetical protein
MDKSTTCLPPAFRQARQRRAGFSFSLRLSAGETDNLPAAGSLNPILSSILLKYV